MPKNNTGRKFNHLQDEWNVKGRGLYAFTPFARLDKHGKTLIKLGMSDNLIKRDQSRQTDFPMGFYYVAVIHDINLKTAKEKDPYKTLDEHTKLMEKYAFELCENSKVIERIRSTLAVKKMDKSAPHLGGMTEWVYAKPKDIQQLFRKVIEKYGGEIGMIQRFDKKELDDIQDNYVSHHPNSYTGEITYPLHNK